MIKTANFYKYLNDRFVNFFQSIVDMFDKNDPNLSNVLSKVEKRTDELKAAYEFERRNELTDNVENLDDRRSKDLRGIKFILRGFSLHYENEKIEAAKRLLQSMNDIDKNIDRLPYVEETSAVRQLVTIWKSNGDYTNWVDTLMLENWLEHLSTINEDFHITYLERINSEAAKNIIPVSRLRESSIEDYTIFAQFLTAYATIDPAKYLPMVKQLNELIDQYNKLQK